MEAKQQNALLQAQLKQSAAEIILGQLLSCNLIDEDVWKALTTTVMKFCAAPYMTYLSFKVVCHDTH